MPKKKKRTELAIIFIYIKYLTKSYRVSTINKYNVSLMQLYAFLIFIQSSLSSVMPFPFALCFTSLKWLLTVNDFVARVTEEWNAHLARNTCSPHHSYPPAVLRKCPERHPSPTLGSATTLRFPLAVISAARSCLVEGGLGNRVSWKLSRVSCAISCESLFHSHTSSITHMPQNRPQTAGSTAQHSAGVLDYVFKFHFSCKRYDVCIYFILFFSSDPIPSFILLTEIE